MLDKNGIEIKTGDVVEITGAYFKNDNGLYGKSLKPERSAPQNTIFVSGLSQSLQIAG